MENIFYVYVLLNPLKKGIYTYNDLIFNEQPFYIGKGKKHRANIHIREYHLRVCNNKLKVNIIKKILANNKKVKIKILYNDLSEKEAYKIEKYLICKIGKRIDGNGPLSNISSGGDGYVRTEKGAKSFAEKMKLKLGGIERPAYVKEKIRNTLKNYKWPESRNKKISDTITQKWKSGKFIRRSYKGKNNPRFIQLDDKTIDTIIDLYKNGNSIFKIHKETGIGRKKIKDTLIEKKII